MIGDFIPLLIMAMVGGALVVCTVARSKHHSEHMLEKYRELLSEARKAKPAPKPAKPEIETTLPASGPITVNK